MSYEGEEEGKGEGKTIIFVAQKERT